jgi:hypothetical protein
VHRRIALAPDASHALDQLAHDTGRSIHDLADEAICDLLKKHRRPRSLLEALRQSTRQHPANDPQPARAKRRSR